MGWLVPMILIRLRTHAMPMVDVTEPFLPLSELGSPQLYQMDPRREEDYFTPPETPEVPVDEQVEAVDEVNEASAERDDFVAPPSPDTEPRKDP
jgi:hypothetical protein